MHCRTAPSRRCADAVEPVCQKQKKAASSVEEKDLDMTPPEISRMKELVAQILDTGCMDLSKLMVVWMNIRLFVEPRSFQGNN